MKEQEDDRATQENMLAPYPPSWVDRLFTWIDGLWGHPWIFYLLVFLLLTLVGNATRWLEGSQPIGTFQPATIAEQPLLLYIPALMQYLNGTARRSLRTFQPMLRVGAAEVSRLEYELTTLPRTSGIMVGVVGSVIGAVSVYTQPDNYDLSSISSWPTFVYTYLTAIASVVFFIAFILHTTRQLRVVSRIHRMAEKINLFERLPVYAFSALTVRTGIGILAILYYYAYIFFVAQLFGSTQVSVIEFSAVGAGLLVAAGSFVLPLYGMHRRLVNEKTRLLAEADRRLEVTLRRLHNQLDAGSLEEMDKLNKAVSILVVERDVLSKIPTWPWRPETLRGFLTSVVVPILLWLSTTVMGRWLGQ